MLFEPFKLAFNYLESNKIHSVMLFVHLQTQQAPLDNVRYELDEYYFMPAPSQLIYTHFPDDPAWQLLERPLTLDEFENLVPVKPAFFKHDLLLLSHTRAVINCHANTNDVNVRIQCSHKKVFELSVL
jgi:hypothetical protein